MNKFDSSLKKMAKREEREAPQIVKDRIEESLSLLPKENKSKIKPFKIVRNTLAAAACLVFAMLVVMPNLSVGYAEKLCDVPVIGSIIKVVTIRNYTYDNGNIHLKVDVPELDPSEGDAAQNINMSVQELTDKILKEFNSNLKEYGGEGHESTSVDYEVLTNSPDWFTLKLTVLTIAASSDTSYEYYHIDRKKGEIVYLEDLFKSEDYAPRIEKIVKKQMKDQMAKDENVIYWTEKEDFGTDFTEITPHHGFYFDDKGNIVITFNKYEVAPGYMGCPEFTINYNDIKDILKDEYKK